MMNRIKKLRISKGDSQNDLSNLLGLSQQTISSYENNTREPDIKTLITLSNYFNVSIDYLLGETDIENRYDDAEIFINHLKKRFSNYGYDLSTKSANEIFEILDILMELFEKIKITSKK